MMGFNEKCFIAWGGNQDLANIVGEKIREMHFQPIVGGGLVTDMFLGNQILKQICQSTHAIILVQGKPNENTRYDFNDNLMFEWGYITSKLPPNRIHVFLIDLKVNNLPSDLMGTWATEIQTPNKSIEDVADEIAKVFLTNASIPIEFNKMDIMHNWENNKRALELHNATSSMSDVELANIILHSIECSYQYMEDDYTEFLLNKLSPVSALLQRVVAIAKTSIILVRETNHLTIPIDFDLFEELKSQCERPLNYIQNDDNLNLWIRFYQADQLAMLNSSVATNEALSEEEKEYYIMESVKNCELALEILNEIVINFPNDKDYADLFIGYIHGHMRYHCFSLINDVESARTHSKIAVEAFKNFYLTYKQLYPGDGYLNHQFAQTYYLDLARHSDYVENVGDRMSIKRSITSFLSKHQQQADRQHKVFTKLKDKADKL